MPIWIPAMGWFWSTRSKEIFRCFVWLEGRNVCCFHSWICWLTCRKRRRAFLQQLNRRIIHLPLLGKRQNSCRPFWRKIHMVPVSSISRDGKVNANFKSYSGKDLADIWKKYAGPYRRYGHGKSISVTGWKVMRPFHFNPQIITEMIKYMADLKAL